MDEDTALDIQSMYVNVGLSIKEIHDQCGYSRQTIRTALRIMGVELRVGGQGKEPDVDWEEVARDYNNPELTVNQVCVKHNITHPYLYGILENLNVPTRQVGHAPQRKMRVAGAMGMYKAGIKVARILAETGLSPTDLYMELEKRGVPRRNNRGIGRGFGEQAAARAFTERFNEEFGPVETDIPGVEGGNVVSDGPLKGQSLDVLE